MVRPFAVKGRKRKKRDDLFKVEQQLKDEEEPEAVEEEEEKEQTPPKKHKEEYEIKSEKTIDELPGIPIVPSNQKSKSGIVFVLERASLEVAKVGKTYQLLNSDDHSSFLRKHNRNPGDYRPDIAHQALLAILDSPLNKAGMLRAVYVRTEKGVLFEVKPHVRIPRTFKRFCGVMLQLLQKLSISSTANREKLLRVIKNPVTQHLPLNSRKVGLSYSSEKLVQLQDYVASAKDDVNLVFVVGAMAHGKIDKDYTDDFISGVGAGEGTKSGDGAGESITGDGAGAGVSLDGAGAGGITTGAGGNVGGIGVGGNAGGVVTGLEVGGEGGGVSGLEDGGKGADIIGVEGGEAIGVGVVVVGAIAATF